MLIGELASTTGVSTKTLRYYEAEGLLTEPDRTPGGYRAHTEHAVGRVNFLRQAQAAGLALAQIGQILAVRDEVDRRLEELHRTRRELLALRRRLDVLDPIDCHDQAICAAVSPVVGDPD